MKRGAAQWAAGCLLAVLLGGCYNPPEYHRKKFEGKPDPSALSASEDTDRAAVAAFPFQSTVMLSKNVRTLNVRHLPGMDGQRMFQLARGKAVTVTAQKKGWFQLKVEQRGKQSGWAFGAYLDLTAYDQMASHEVAGQEERLLFRQPSLEAEVGLRLKPGDRYLTVGEPDETGWSKVLMPDGTELFTR